MTPVRIRGVTYRSMEDAAKAEGVHVRTVQFHLDAGTPDLIGKQRPTQRRPCTIEGVDYPSLRAAADALGVTVEAIRQRANRADKAAQKETILKEVECSCESFDCQMHKSGGLL